MDQENTNEENKDKPSKEALGILELSNQVNEFAGLFGTRMISIEAMLFLNRDLLATILSHLKGVSKEQLDRDLLENLKTYEAEIAKAYAAKLNEFKEHLADDDTKVSSFQIRQLAINIAEASEQGKLYPSNFPNIAKTINNKILNDAIEEITQDLIENGSSYTQAFSKRPEIFPPEFLRALVAGDEDGDLAKHLLIFIKYRDL